MAGLNETPSSERIRIGFFGIRNVGKSSLVNAVCGQDLAVVSDVAGTTTDIVHKSMELLPVGPVVIVDTPGIDDEGALGELRVKQTRKTLNNCDTAVLVTEAGRELLPAEEELLGLFKTKEIPYVVALNKVDTLAESPQSTNAHYAYVSALTGKGVYELKELIAHQVKDSMIERSLVSDLIDTGEIVVLVIPIDSSAPKNRLILPQQMVMRDILDARAICAVCQPEELSKTLDALTRRPKLVITDSQAFDFVASIVPEDIFLTSFSILMARYRGTLDMSLAGVRELDSLHDGSKILIAEGCSHHRQCEDIGTVKMPAWIRGYANCNPTFNFTSGGDFPDCLADYDLVVHCGGCMLNSKEMEHRVNVARLEGVSITNYGMAIAYMNGILKRSLEVFEFCD